MGFTRKDNHPEALLDAAKLTPSSEQNVLRDVIAPALEKAKIEWHGFHAFRRGLHRLASAGEFRFEPVHRFDRLLVNALNARRTGHRDIAVP